MTCGMSTLIINKYDLTTVWNLLESQWALLLVKFAKYKNRVGNKHAQCIGLPLCLYSLSVYVR